ncbi:MAG: DUF6986 family protein, partial [Acidimicrobiales bacterium]
MHAALAAQYPGESGARQPVHTVYGGAHLFRADSARKLGDLALRALDDTAPDARTFAEAIGLDPALADTVYARVRAKLGREPVEDFRIDFEDGYGNRPDDEEDATADAAALETARGLDAGTLPPFIGIRIKPLSRELERRAARTLDRFFRALVARTGARLPPGFVVTLPKIQAPEQVAACADLVGALESALALPAGAVKLELMVETPQAIVDASGRCPLPA